MLFLLTTQEFVVQFGIASDPNETAKWEFANIRDDPVRHSNVQGTVSFAMEAGVNDSRTTQLFINLHNNNSRRLDGLGFAPIGRIVAGLDVVGNVFNSTPNDPNGVDQDAYQNGGNEWILRHYPDIDIIVNSTLVMGEHKSNVQIAETPFAPISKDIPMAHSNGVLLSKLDLPRNSAAMWIAIFLLLLPFWTLFTFLSGIENRRLRVERVLSQVATATSTRSMRASL